LGKGAFFNGYGVIELFLSKLLQGGFAENFRIVGKTN
jgi:hypothetical protein